MYVRRRLVVLVCVQSALRVATSSVLLGLSLNWDGYAPSMAVADGTTDCDSVVVCAARWSHMASGDGMVYLSGLYHGGLPVMVGHG